MSSASLPRGGVLAGLLLCALPGVVLGVGGELTKRQQEIVAGIVEYAPWDCPDRWLYELGDVSARNTILREAMLDAVSWVDFLALGNALDWSREEALKTHDFLLAGLPQTASGKVRQNAVFLVAFTCENAVDRLRPVFRQELSGTTAADKIDAGCALAALGDQEAIDWFMRDFGTTDVFVGKPVFNFSDYVKEEAEEESREVVRSYRFWEIIFRRPYYRSLEFLARSAIYRMTAQHRSETERDALASRLLPAFLSKWHGHPGSDDIAMRMMNLAVEKHDLRSIYVWAQRASLLPDQDCAEVAVHLLTALADSQLSAHDLDEVAASEDGKQNQEFLVYERFIRIARKDLAAGLAFFDREAADRPESVFALARRHAAKVPPSAALRDGRLEDLTLKIMLDYPKRSKGLGETRYEPNKDVSEDEYLGLLTSRERQIVLRTRLTRKRSVKIDAGALASQYRLHLELSNLIKMEEEAGDDAVKADLRYRQAMLFYRESRTMFPVWEREIMNAGFRLNAVRYDAEADGRLEEYVAETFALRRAYALFDSIRDVYPGYEGMDLVLFHMGHSYVKLMDYRPAKGVAVWPFPDRRPRGSEEDPIEFAHGRVAEIFQRLIKDYPESEWSAKVEDAAKWHAKMAKLLRTKREKAERSSPRNKQAPTTPKIRVSSIDRRGNERDSVAGASHPLPERTAYAGR